MGRKARADLRGQLTINGSTTYRIDSLPWRMHDMQLAREEIFVRAKDEAPRSDEGHIAWLGRQLPYPAVSDDLHPCALARFECRNGVGRMSLRGRADVAAPFGGGTVHFVASVAAFLMAR